MAAGLNTALLTVAVTAMQGAAKYMSLHSAAPDGSGSNETAAARKLITWDTASQDMAFTDDLAFTGGAASGDCKYAGLWSASTGGTFYGYQALTGDQAFNAAGEYTVTAGTWTGSAS